MNKRVQIAVCSIVIGIVAMLALQYVWINKYYKQELARIARTTTLLLNDCSETELHISNKERQQYLWDNNLAQSLGEVGSLDYENRTISVIIGYPEKKIIKRDNVSDVEIVKYSAQSYMMYHWSGINLNRLDSLYTVALEQTGITIPHFIEKIDRAAGNVIETTWTDENEQTYDLSTSLIELGIDDKEGLIARFGNSGFAVLILMKNMIIISAIIIILLAVILTFLFRTIVYQKKLSEMREDYVNAMTHEIKNPIIYLKRLLGLIDSPEQKRRIIIAEYKIEHLRLMLEKLLAVSKKEGLSICPQDIDLSDCLTSIVAQYRLENPDLNITLETDTKKTNITVDKLHFTNSVINLIDNAIKYSEKNPVINVRCYEAEDKLCISVKDEGIGIPFEYHSRIFLKSFRIPESKSLKRYGFGLGLSYVKMVVEAHHGTISLNSAPGEGSEFIIHLDIAKASAV